MSNNFANDKYQQFKTDICDMIFVIDNDILGDDMRAIILSLLNNFLSIMANVSIHNIELSQFYVIGTNKQYDNCEILLRYNIISSDSL